LRILAKACKNYYEISAENCKILAMHKSILILGRQPALGLAELESLYGAANLHEVLPNVAAVDKPASEINFAPLGGSTR